MKRKIIFEGQAFQDFTEWAAEDRKLYQRIADLIMDILRQLLKGIGKPEPLKHELKGYWSRRINHEHRPVYKISDDSITIASCKYHYD
jgi:toxin YoeB